MIRATLAACALVAVSGESHWAVLVAGSNGYGNYRHQADVCHAYHVLTSRGFSSDRIIVMMFDDVANSRENPIRGKLYNYPWKTMEEAVDVYDGCKIDYKGKDVTPGKFMAVLTGDSQTAGGKVLQSTAEDHVFVNFVDHGAVGLIGFPDGIPGPSVLHAKDLISTLEKMHQKGMYKQLAFYLETCESGSMFQGLLPKDLPVYAVTAANAKESSWGTWCGPDAKVGGKAINSCLGDLFSVNWMMDSDKTIKDNETLKTQYAAVKKQTSKSHVMHYGEVKQFSSELVSDFQGAEAQVGAVRGLLEVDVEMLERSAVDSRNAKLHYLYHVYLSEKSRKAEDNLIDEIQARRAVTQLGAELLASTGAQDLQLEDEISWTEQLLECHARAVADFDRSCGWKEGNYVLSKTLYTLCVHASGDANRVAAAVSKSCAQRVPEITI